MRREIVEAVREAFNHPDRDKCPCPTSADDPPPWPCDACCERAARAVLRAALAGEPEGSWKVKQDDEMWWVLLTSHDGVAGTAFGTEADALAVANALNLSRDLAAGGKYEE